MRKRAAVLLLLPLAAARPIPTPQALEGRWQAGEVIDPAGGVLPAPAALREALDSAELPRTGEAVALHGGWMCIGHERCRDVTWQAQTLGHLLGGGRLAGDFHLPRTTRAWLGSGPNPNVVITLVARPGGGLLAVVPLCDPAPGSPCRNGYQRWTPAAR